MSFYRIYRPQIISEIDNVSVREQLLTLLHKDKSDLPHAYLFSGPKGTGKTTAARIVAKIFNCTKLSKREGPCGKCEQCVSIAKGTNMDMLEIDAASNRGIDDIRTLREQIGLTPVSGDYKIYIIDEVHMLTMEAFNALLKTLEEPPPHAVFVLATTDAGKVPVTIKSRCMRLTFSAAGKDELTSALVRIVKKEKIVIDKEALGLLVQAADGSFRDATKLLEQLSFHRGKISEDTVRKTLVLSEEKILNQFIDALMQKDVKRGLSIIGQLVVNGHDMKQFLIDILQKLETQLLNDLESEEIREAIKRFTQAYAELRISPIPQLPLELAVIEFCGEQTYATPSQTGLLTTEKLTEHWTDVIASLKSYNHSVAGVLRSSRPKEVKNGIVTIEAFYKFHLDKLSEPKTKEVLVATFKKLFGEKTKVEVVLGRN
ncbi:MAG: hypothetical protein ACD_36C00055G0006 [uncultured bacterium]|nr:MAG: hypothetical protein ACD_36C00055G0006 [uncultured bacterium]